MRKKADEIAVQGISEEDAVREFVSFMFDELRKSEEDYPEDKHEEMIEKAISSILNNREAEELAVPDVDLSSLTQFASDLEEMTEIAKKLEKAYPGADNLLYKAIFEGGSEEDFEELKTNQRPDYFNDEMEVEFHPDFMHYHRREDGSIEMHSGDEYIDKRESLNYQINKISKKKDSFIDNITFCRARALKIALIVKVAVCSFNNAKKTIRPKLTKFFDKFSKKSRSGAIDRVKSTRVGLVEKGLGYGPTAMDYIKFTHVTYIVSAYLTYKYLYIINIIDLWNMLGNWPTVEHLVSDLALSIGMAYLGIGLLRLPNLIYKMRKYSKLINKSCAKLKKIEDFCREKGIVKKLRAGGANMIIV